MNHQEEIMDWIDYPKEFLAPLMLPEYILDAPDLEEWQKENLQNNKIVLIRDYWCVLSKKLPVYDKPIVKEKYWLKFKH